MAKEMATLQVGNVTIKLALSPGNSQGQIIACYELSGGGQEIHRGRLFIDTGAIKEAVLKSIAARGPVGWSFKQLRRKANKLAHRVSVNKIAREVATIASDPRFQKVASAAAVIYPPLGVPMGVAVKTAQIYQQAKAGDPKARAQVVKIIQGAEGGDPNAQKLARGIAIFQAATKHGYDVGGWADNIKRGWLANIPYRTNLEAGELDRHRPGHVARGLYNLQLRAIARGEFPGGKRHSKRK